MHCLWDWVCGLGCRAWEEDVLWGEPITPVAGAGSGSVRAAGHYWSFTIWVQIWVKMLLPLARSHHKTATGKEPAGRRDSSEDVKRLQRAEESNFPSRLHFGIRSMRGIVRSMHHGDKLTLVSKKNHFSFGQSEPREF